MDRLGQRQRAAPPELALERDAVEAFHRHVGQPPRGRPVSSRGDDVGVTQELERFAFDPHAIDHVGLQPQIASQEFHDDPIRAALVDSIVDLAHSARSEPRHGAVRSSLEKPVHLRRSFRAHGHLRES